MTIPRNPYVAGNPLRGERGFFGRQDILTWVEQELRNPDTNALVLFGQRRIGKTTLLLQLARTLPDDAFVPVYFDLHDQAAQPLSQVLADLADLIAKQVGMETPDLDAFDDRGHFFHHTFLPQLYHTLGDNRRPVFLLDEFDVLGQATRSRLPETVAAQAFFPFLRDVMTTDPRPAFVFVVGRQAEDLSLDFTATFKTSLSKQIWVLDEESAKRLVRQAEANDTLRFDDQAVARVLSLTNRHPYLTQLLCHRLWVRAYRKNLPAPVFVDVADVDAVVPDALETGANVLVWIWEGLSLHEKFYASALAEIADEGEIISEDRIGQVLKDNIERLRLWDVDLALHDLRDLVRRRVLEEDREGKYRFAVELFRCWLYENKPLHQVKDELDRVEPWAERLFSIGRDAHYRGHWEEAVDFFTRALKESPQHFRSQLYLGEVLLEQRRTKDAVTELERAYKLSPREAGSRLAHALVVYAREQEQAGYAKDAINICERALAVLPGDQEAQEMRIAILIRHRDALLEQDDVDAALDAHQKVEAKPEESVDFFHRVLEKEPGHFDTRFNLGKVLLELDQINAAVTELEWAYKLNQQDGRALLVRALVAQAKAQEEANREDGALATYERVLEISPDHPKALDRHVNIWIRRGDAAMEQGDIDDAMSAYERVLGISPNHPKALAGQVNIWIRRGDAAMERGDIDDALTAYWRVGSERLELETEQLENVLASIRRALQRDHLPLSTQLNLGEVLLGLQRTDEAVDVLEQAYTVNQEEARFPLIRTLVAHAKALERTGKEQGALAACDRALEISPGEREVQEIRTNIWIRRRDAALEQNELGVALDAHRQAGIEPGEGSLVFFESVLIRYPQHLRARLQRGQMLLDLDQPDKAVAELERAYELNSEEGRSPLSHALVAWAKAQAKAGEEEDALTNCERALEISPDEQEAQELQTAIWIQRGDAALEMDEFDVALAAYERAGDEQKVQIVEKRKRQQDFETAEREAGLYEKAREWARAARIYRQLIDDTTDEKLEEKWQAALQRVEEHLKAETSRETKEKPEGWPSGHVLDDRYKLVRQLTTTRCSEIYLAEELQPPHDTLVVKRLMRIKLSDDSARGRFEREIVVLRQIRHQSVLSLYDSKTMGSDRYFVTEFADKGTLKEYLIASHNHKLRPAEAIEIALSACQGLEAAHRQGIIHRDFKPGNIFLFSQRDGSVVAKLGDFSVARVPKELEDGKLTQEGAFVGTYPYAAPEQFGKESIDQRADLYSWAVVLFEMLTGESPTDSLKDPLSFLPTKDEFPKSFFIDKGVPPVLVEVLQRNLHQDRTLRYSTVAKARETLETIESQIVVDIEHYLSAGEKHITSSDWQSADVEFEQGLKLCEWYGEPDKLRGPIGELARRLDMGRQCAQGMMHLNNEQWQAAIEALGPLRTLDPNYLGLDISAQLKQVQAERQREQKYQRLDQYRERGDWVKILRLARDLTTSYEGGPEGESVGDIRKLALYARGKSLLEEGELESAYHQFYRLYQEDSNYEDVTELCSRVAFNNAMREDIPFSWDHQVEWLGKAIEVDRDHRNGRTQRQLDRARHRWAEELLE